MRDARPRGLSEDLWALFEHTLMQLEAEIDRLAAGGEPRIVAVTGVEADGTQTLYIGPRDDSR